MRFAKSLFVEPGKQDNQEVSSQKSTSQTPKADKAGAMLDVNQKYTHIPSSHKSGVNVTLIDPVFVNPNSLETIAQVLRHMV